MTSDECREVTVLCSVIQVLPCSLAHHDCVEGWPGALIVTAIEHGISTCNSTPCKILLRGKSLDQVLGIPYQKLQNYVSQHHFPGKAIIDAVSIMLEGQCVCVKFNCPLKYNDDDTKGLLNHMTSLQSHQTYLTAVSIQLVGGGGGCHTILSYPPFTSTDASYNPEDERSDEVSVTTSLSFFTDEPSLLVPGYHIDDVLSPDSPSLPPPPHSPAKLKDHLLLHVNEAETNSMPPVPHASSTPHASLIPHPSSSHTTSQPPRCITPELFSDEAESYCTPELFPQTDSFLKLKRTLYYGYPDTT